MTRFDFAVLGGGPSGCAFAMLAARAGASVLVIERGDHERPRPGEHLSGKIRGALDALGVPLASARALLAPSPGILSLWNGATPLTKPYVAHGEPDALCVIRHRFDALLFESARSAGCEARSRCKLVTAERDGHGWQLGLESEAHGSERLSARSVIDASGRSASFARMQGAEREHSGDLFAIVGWLEAGAPQRHHAMLRIEACNAGWWSFSTGADGILVATLYTSLGVLREARVEPQVYWARALGETRTIARSLQRAGGALIATGAYPAFPSRSSRAFGSGWIALGDAAMAFDPLGGQGVVHAFETAFRAFEAAQADPDFSQLGPAYEDALRERYERHLEGRKRVYAEAGSRLSRDFLERAV